MAYSANIEMEYIKAPGTVVWVRGEKFAFISRGTVTNTMETTATV